ATFSLFYVPIALVMWFAPLLAGWHGLGAGKAMFGSIVGLWRNKGAILVYGLLMACIWMGVSLIAVAITGPLSSSPETMSWLLAPVASLMATFKHATFYPMYRSIHAPAPG